MNWQAFGAIGEFIGAAAVLVSLIYLALQIRQNAKATQSAGAQSMLLAAQNTALSAAQSGENASIWMRGLANYSLLEEAEKTQIRLILNSQIVATDTLYWSFRQGTLDKELWDRQSNWMRAFLSSEAGRITWENTRHGPGRRR